MLWTITYSGTEKTLADWGLTQAVRSLASQDDDTLSFVADGAPVDGAPLFPIKSTLILKRNRTQDSGGVWSGGAIWFQGLVTQIPRRGDPSAESNSYKVSGPWWYLRTRVFEKVFHVFSAWTVPNDPTTLPILISKTFSHCFLMVDQTVAQPDPTLGYGKLNTGQQLIEALNWALKPFTDASAAPPFQIGTVTPNLDVPIQEVRDITCAEVVRMCLRWSPDAVTWFDYTTSPPTFNCKRRADFAPVNVDVSTT